MTNQYHVYVNTSRISWQIPSEQIYLVWSAVFVPDEEKDNICSSVEDLVRGIPDLRMHLTKKSGKEVDDLISALSDLLGRCQIISDEIPLQSMLTPDEAFTEALPEILRRIDSVVSSAQVRVKVYCNNLNLIFQSVHPSVNGYFMTAPDDGGLVLAGFAEWSRGHHLWQSYIYGQFEEKLTDFQSWMMEYPLLGTHHATGRQILRAIKKAPIEHIVQSTWVRAREESTIKPVFTSDDMWPPPPDRTGEGRYNHMGKPVLYLASDRVTCGAEVVEVGEEKIIWMQDFEIRDKTVLDLTAVFDPQTDVKLGDQQLLVAALQGVVTQAARRDSNWKPEYFIPRFIADIARMMRQYDGIKYSSQRGSGINLALFDWTQGVSPIGDTTRSLFANRSKI